MATFTSNFGLTKPDYGEAAAIAVINGNTDEIDEIMHDNRYMMADAWSSSVSYAVGDLCIYENALYKCVTATSGNWDASCWEVTTLAENLGGTPEVSKTATGNPLELTDAASAPMVRCVTEIQGTQDLHGYSKPWVGGAGKNKLPLVLDEIKARNTSGTWSENTYTISGLMFSVETDGDGNVTGIKGISGTASGSDIEFTITNNMGLPTGSYIINGAISNGKRIYFYNGTTWYDTTGTDKSFTIVGSETLQRVRIVIANGQTLNNDMFYPMVRLSSESDSTFAPYSNICPITAYTEGKIEVMGKNIVDQSTFVQGSINGTGDDIASTTRLRSPLISVTPNNDYAFSTNSELLVMEIDRYDSNGTWQGLTTKNATSTTYTVPNGTYYIKVLIRKSDNSTITPSELTKFQMEKGSSATAFEPFTNTTHTTTYPTAIYRGSEDVAVGSVGANGDGEEWIFMEFDGSVDEDWGIWDDGKRAVITLPIAPYYVSGSTTSQIICNQYEATTANNTFSGVMGVANDSSRLYVCDGTGTMVLADFKTWLSNNPLQIAYRVKTPTTSTVTVSNTPIRTLSGYNHIASTTGEMEVEYITREYEPIVKAAESELGEKYSTSERVVGTWIDGKPIYEQILHINSGWASEMHIPVTNLKYLLSFRGFGIASNNNTFPISNYYAQNTDKMFIYGEYNVGIMLEAGSAYYNNYGNVYLTIRYTKTTD